MSRWIEVVMHPVGEHALDKSFEVRVGHLAAPDAVVGRGEPANRSREQDAAGPQYPERASASAAARYAPAMGRSAGSRDVARSYPLRPVEVHRRQLRHPRPRRQPAGQAGTWPAVLGYGWLPGWGVVAEAIHLLAERVVRGDRRMQGLGHTPR